MKSLAVPSLLTLVSCAATVAEFAVDEYDRVPANECDRAKYRIYREARRNDTADRYMLDDDGTFFRWIKGIACTITYGVEDFKVSKHPNDAAVVYYKKGGDLYMINLDTERRAGESARRPPGTPAGPCRT